MARVTLTPSALTPNAGIADPAGTASVAGAGNGFTVPYQGGKQLYFRASNASGGAGNFVVLAGSQPSAISSGQGSSTTSVANSTTQWFGPFDSSRFQQADGAIYIESSVVLTVTAFTVDGRYVA